MAMDRDPANAFAARQWISTGSAGLVRKVTGLDDDAARRQFVNSLDETSASTCGHRAS
jgi:hypothetical protein